MFSLSHLIQYSVFGLLVWIIYGAIWRLFLSPIAKFPGPKLAAMTFWYEFYFDAIENGSYVYEIERMHKMYGPITRINPYELHVLSNDLEWISQLYPTVGREVDKFWWSAGMFGNTDMTFGTVPHALHRRRRAAFSKFFSTAMIRKLEPMLQALTISMCTKVQAGIEAGKKVNLVHVFSALTQDVITEYCFAKCRDVLEMEDFAPHYYDWLQIHCTLTPIIKQLPWLIPLLDHLPDWWMKAASPAAWLLRVQKADYHEQTRRVLGKGQDRTSHATIFHALKDDPDIPLSEKSQDRLAAEASAIVGAGTLTPAHMLSLTTFMVLDNLTVLQNLMSELVQAFPEKFGSISLSRLECLPYLDAVINEGLRLSHGSLHRLTRVHPHEALKFQDWTIPPNTAVGMTAYLNHIDPDLFPDPRTFDPARWLCLGEKGSDHMHKYLGNFGRGSRQCVGMRLAYAEIRLALGYLFRRLGDELKLFDTEHERDIEFVHNYFIPAPHFHSKGLRVVKKEKSRVSMDYVSGVA